MTDDQVQDKSKPIRNKRCPLGRHQTGQWYKKIKGKFYYFGTKKSEAVKAYYEQIRDIHAESEPVDTVETNQASDLNLRQLCNLYLAHQESRVNAGELTRSHLNQWKKELQEFSKFIGRRRHVADITTLNIQKYRSKLIRAGKRPTTISFQMAAVKALFHWAQDNEMMDQGPELRAIKSVRETKCKERDQQRIPSQKRQTFTAAEIRRLLQHADVKMTAMIWLAINCGFGGSDIGDLRWEDLDLEAATVDLPRGKTGIPRHLTLWPETIEALRQVPRRGPLVFYTAQGKPWVRYHPTSGCRADNIGPRFRQLMDRAGIERQRGTGFYTLRRTAATIAAKSGDIFGVQGLMGHATTRTSSGYVQTVSHQADKAVDLVRQWYVRGVRNENDR